MLVRKKQTMSKEECVISKWLLVFGGLLLTVTTTSHADVWADIWQDQEHVLPWNERARSLIGDGEAQYSFEWENDYFGGTDRHYTNGLFIGSTWESRRVWLQDEDGLQVLHCSSNQESEISKCEFDNPEAMASDLKHLKGTLYLKQLMYTPSDLKLTPAETDQYDRPYAGWAAVGWQVSETNALGDYEFYDLSIGCVGECSKAGDLQRWVHRDQGLLSGTDPRGWNTQIEGGLVLQAQYQRSFAPVNDLFDKTKPQRVGNLYGDIQLGQVFTRVGLGVHLDLTRPTSAQDAKLTALEHVNFSSRNQIGGGGVKKKEHPSIKKKERPSINVNWAKPSGWDIYLDSAVHFVAHNSLIEGLPFRDDGDTPTRDARPWIWSNTLGILFGHGGWTAGLEFQTRSTEVEGLPFRAFDHKWARIVVNKKQSVLDVPVTLAFLLSL